MPVCPSCNGLGFDEGSDDECHLCEGSGVIKDKEDEKAEDSPTFNPDQYGEDADWWKKDDEVKD